MTQPITDEEYEALADFRRQLRSFLSFSEGAAVNAGITPQQHQALLALRAAENMTLSVGDLAEHLYLRPHSATGLVDRLEKQGLACRAVGEDRRRVCVSISESGQEIIEALATAHKTELRRLRPTLQAMLSRL